MFTGIVESLGHVTSIDGDSSDARLTIADTVVTEDLTIGDSISVNGVCLTAVTVEPDSFTVQAVTETLRRTNLGQLETGSPVNLERAMPAAGRFDGHIVQGHVDGVGVIDAIAPEGDGQRWTIRAPEPLRRYIVEKGSITVNGVSLTVAGVEGVTFQIALIPHTLSVTTFGVAAVGDDVNLEVDILAKYIERLMESES